MLEQAPFRWWYYHRWGVKALVALGRKAEALQYAESSRGLNDSEATIAEACESILLSSGLTDEAYRRYGLAANQRSTYLATFRSLSKKYPHLAASRLLNDLVASTPGQEGKWFAAAKDAGELDMALALAQHSPTDPRTLIRATRDYAETHPEFALDCGFQAARWIALGYGYEFTEAESREMHRYLWLAATAAGKPDGYVVARLQRASTRTPS